MLGVFGKVSRVRELGFKPSVVYMGLDRVGGGFDEKTVPLLWVPRTSSLGEGVVDVYDRRYLFAFRNSGCIANPEIIRRAVEALERAASMGYRKIMLDAVRLPSPVDGLFFLTTCFCSYSHELYPEIAVLRNRIREFLHKPSIDDLIEVLEELAHARAVHVEHILSILYDKARELGVELVAAVFPYPLSRYVGQEPRVLKKYLREVHVMLYHRCSGAACLNAELGGLAEILRILGLSQRDTAEVIGYVSGLRLGAEEIGGLDKGIGIDHVEKLMEVNRDIYGDKYVPIIWLDDVTIPRLGRYLDNYRNLDLFVA